jgi:hypothetical protein
MYRASPLLGATLLSNNRLAFCEAGAAHDRKFMHKLVKVMANLIESIGFIQFGDEVRNARHKYQKYATY